jgi:hypothetical protein
MVRNRDRIGEAGITCSSMGVAFSACRLPPAATCGVNANILAAEQHAWWLMAYLNSRLVTYLVRGVLLRGNMITSGYVARIPLPELPPLARHRLDAIARGAHANGGGADCVREAIRETDGLLQTELGIGERSAHKLREFSRDLLRRT